MATKTACLDCCRAILEFLAAVPEPPRSYSHRAVPPNTMLAFWQPGVSPLPSWQGIVSRTVGRLLNP